MTMVYLNGKYLDESDAALRMDERGMEALSAFAGEDRRLADFWKEIRHGYLRFEEKRIPEVPTVDDDGVYVFGD